MKVLYCTPNYPSLHKPTAGIMVKEFVKVIREYGIDLRVVHLDERLCWPFTKLKRYQKGFCEVSEVEPDASWLVRYKVLACPGAAGISWRAKRWTGGLMKHLSTIWPDFCPDIVHARTFIPSALACEKLAEKWNSQLLISTHGADTRSFISRGFTRSEIMRLCKKGIPVICVSEMIRKTLMDHGADKENLHLIYNGMDASKIFKGDTPLKRKYAGKLMVLGVGNLQPYKGFNIFIEAIAKLRESYSTLCGVIVGGGQEELNLRNQIKVLGLEHAIELVGVKPVHETMEYMAACDIFCLPSWSEGFGIVYLEAMAHGKPVIAVKGQGITNIVEDSDVGIMVPPKDAVAVAEAIKKLVENKKVAQDMGMRAEMLIQEKFSWRNCASQYLKIYDSMINGRC